MEILIGLIILIFSAILHEIAHGYVADRLGDPTARLAGRLTLNPVKHIDLFWTILLPLFFFLSQSPILFGGAKPVPVDPFNLKEGRKDIALVSLAGPLTNILLALLASICLKLFFPHSVIEASFATAFFRMILITLVDYNLLLAIFNLLPIPPLDGSKIFSLLLPERQAAAYLSLGQFGVFILLILLMLPPGAFSLQHMIFAMFTFSRTLLGL